jgi:hypothetical protein
LQLESGSISTHLRTVEDVDAWWSNLLQRYPGFDWTDSNPRVVKAPCAFDAREAGILVKQLALAA